MFGRPPRLSCPFFSLAFWSLLGIKRKAAHSFMQHPMDRPEPSLLPPGSPSSTTTKIISCFWSKNEVHLGRGKSSQIRTYVRIHKCDSSCSKEHAKKVHATDACINTKDHHHGVVSSPRLPCLPFRGHL